MSITAPVDRWKQKAFEAFLRSMAMGEGSIKERMINAFVDHLLQKDLFHDLHPDASEYVRDIGWLVFHIEFAISDINNPDPASSRSTIEALDEEEFRILLQAILKTKEIIDEAAVNGSYQVPA